MAGHSGIRTGPFPSGKLFGGTAQPSLATDCPLRGRTLNRRAAGLQRVG